MTADQKESQSPMQATVEDLELNHVFIEELSETEAGAVDGGALHRRFETFAGCGDTSPWVTPPTT